MFGPGDARKCDFKKKIHDLGQREKRDRFGQGRRPPRTDICVVNCEIFV